MTDLLNVLFMPNWRVRHLSTDREDIPAPNKILSPDSYWFFRHCKEGARRITVLDNFSFAPVKFIEDRIKISIQQSIRALFAARKYDLVLSHGSNSSMLFLFIATVFKVKKPPFILIDIGCFNRARENKVELFFIKIAARSIDYIIYHSSIQKEWYAKHLPFLLNRSRFVHFGVDEEEFQPGKAAVPGKYILSFGPPGRGRDYKTLLSSWEGVSNKGYKLLIVGQSDLQHLGYGKLPANIEIIGPVTISELRAYIIGCAFVVLPLPYYKHSYGQMSFLQSMACGKAVITTRTPSTVDYITDDSGILVEHQDPADLESRIKFLMENPAEAARLGENARRRVVEEYNEEKMAREINSVIEDVVRERSGAR